MREASASFCRAGLAVGEVKSSLCRPGLAVRSVCSPGSDRGFAMAALLVMMSVMAVAMSVALPVWHTAAQREKEEELIFRGQQYARALALFQRRLPGAVPADIDALVNGRFLRKKYKDPMTGDDFQLVRPGDPATAFAPQGGAAAPGVQPGRPGGPGAAAPGTAAAPGSSANELAGRTQGLTVSGRGTLSAPQPGGGSTFSVNQAGGGRSTFGIGGPTTGGGAAGIGAAGGIIGVVSKSKDTSFRVYNGRNHYNEWVFVATQQTLRAGGPGGAAGPGGRGAAQPGVNGTQGRGGFPQTPGRGFNPQGGGFPTQPQVPGGRGPFQPPPSNPR